MNQEATPEKEFVNEIPETSAEQTENVIADTFVQITDEEDKSNISSEPETKTSDDVDTPEKTQLHNNLEAEEVEIQDSIEPLISAETDNNSEQLEPTHIPELDEELASDETSMLELEFDQAEIPESEAESETEAEAEIESHESQAESQASVEDYTTNYSRIQLAELLNQLVQTDDINSVKARVSLIKIAFTQLTKEELKKSKQEFIANGGKAEDFQPVADEAEQLFNAAFDIYKERKKQYIEELKNQKKENLEKKNALIEELKQLVDSEEPIKVINDKYKALNETWKQIGSVPKEATQQLWETFHYWTEKLFDKKKIEKELKEYDLKKNLDKKLAICEKAEKLLVEPSIAIAFKQLQQCHEEWREVGPVPADKREEIWERFRKVTETINENRRLHYESLKQEFENNLRAKKALCDETEQILNELPSTVKQWQEQTQKIQQAVTLWKSIGPAPATQNKEIWERFRTLVNTFFTLKKEYFAKIKEEQINNYNTKVNICIQAEALKNTQEWKKATAEILKLQQEWRNTGPVPRKYSDKIWKRFRAACDEFFAAKNHYFTNLSSIEQENLEKKLALLKKVEEYQFGADNEENLQIIQAFQREWMEIGRVPLNKKDEIQEQFRQLINKHMDTLKLKTNELRALQYKTKIENIKASPGGDKALFRERTFLQQKIAALQSEINLWENNIGFLSKSKQAQLLRQEYEEKIEKNKQELQLLEAKLRLLVKGK